MGNGKREKGNGKWEMGNGKWEMGNVKREMGNGKFIFPLTFSLSLLKEPGSLCNQRVLTRIHHHLNILFYEGVLSNIWILYTPLMK